MANKKITDLTAGTSLASGDLLPVVDISDTTDAPTGTTKKWTWVNVVKDMFASRFAADAGSNDTYVATLTPAPAAYVTGEHYRFKANTANTGACTINFNSLGAKTIKKAAGGITTDLADNDIRAGQWVDLIYDGTNMQMQSTLGNGAATVTDATISMSDITTNNSSTSQHGFLKKLDNDSAHFMDGTGSWSTPGAPPPASTIAIGGIGGLTAMYKLVRNASSDQWSAEGNMTANYSQTGAQAAISHADGYFSAWQSTTGLSNVGNMVDSSYNKSQLSWHPIYSTRMRTDTSDISNSRIWVGLFSGDPFGSATPSVHLIAFRYDTGADGTAFWRCVTDNGSGTPTVTTTTQSIAVDTTYDLRFDVSSSDVKFYINGTLVATHTTTLPTSTTAIGWQIGVKSLSGSNKLIYCNNIVMIQPR